MAQDGPTRKPRRSPEQVERGLRAVAQAQGNTRTAAGELAREGAAISRSTLRNWTRQHAELYKRLSAERTPATSPPANPGTLRTQAVKGNGDQAAVLDRARELIGQRLAELDRDRQEDRAAPSGSHRRQAVRDTRIAVNVNGNQPERSAAEVVAKLVELGAIEPEPKPSGAQRLIARLGALLERRMAQ